MDIDLSRLIDGMDKARRAAQAMNFGQEADDAAQFWAIKFITGKKQSPRQATIDYIRSEFGDLRFPGGRVKHEIRFAHRLVYFYKKKGSSTRDTEVGLYNNYEPVTDITGNPL